MPDDSTPDPDTLADRVAERLLARLEGPLLDVLAERIAGKVVERLEGRAGAVEPGAEALAERVAERVAARLGGGPPSEGAAVLDDPGRLRDLVGMVMSRLGSADLGGVGGVAPSAVHDAALRLPVHRERLGPRAPKKP